MRTLARLAAAMRPDQWTKNLVLFAGLLFSGALGDAGLTLLALGGFVVFCALSGASYIMNDLVDLERDRAHPEKKTRPLASGALAPRPAAAFAGAVVVLALVGAFSVNPGFGGIALGYFALNVLYTVVLRRTVILDVMAIAVGFVLRAVASVEALRSIAPATEISPWLLVCTFFLALFLGLGKRRHELLMLGDAAPGHRATLSQYSAPLLDALIGVVTASTVVSYAIYSIWPGTVQKVGSSALVYTVPFVAYGVFRYLYLMFARSGGGKPSRSLISDVPLAVDILLWAAVVAYIIYLR